jgi:hypothetical protein
VRILNLGAGVQSTTVYLMVHAGTLPPIDYAIFADTQEEPAAVYAHLDWLRGLGGPPILTATAGKLGDDLVRGRNSTGQRFVSIPAYTTTDDGASIGIARRQCSREYKTRVIEQTIRRQILGLAPGRAVPRGMTIAQLFGFSLDEGGRARRLAALFKREHRWTVPDFPLIERFMTRADCLTWLRDRVPHETPRSACVFCPYHTDAEWERIKQQPAEWQRAIAVDEALRGERIQARDRAQVLYLHRSGTPLAEVTLDPQPRDRQMPLSFYQECEGVCGV